MTPPTRGAPPASDRAPPGEIITRRQHGPAHNSSADIDAGGGVERERWVFFAQSSGPLVSPSTVQSIAEPLPPQVKFAALFIASSGLLISTYFVPFLCARTAAPRSLFLLRSWGAEMPGGAHTFWHDEPSHQSGRRFRTKLRPERSFIGLAGLRGCAGCGGGDEERPDRCASAAGAFFLPPVPRRRRPEAFPCKSPCR